MTNIVSFSRRSFLTALGLSTAGLCLGVYAQKVPTNEPAGNINPKPNTSSQKEEDKSSGLNPNAFIHIASTGVVSIICHRSEMGQGIRSSLPVLLADELGADMKQVKIIQAEGDKKYGDQNTDGSNSIRGFYDTLRKAAATARFMLIQAAAQKLNVAPETLYAENNFIIQKATKKRLSFGELAVAAGKLPVPATEKVHLRPDKELKNVGKILPLLDGSDYVTGRAQFGADVKLPNMLIAVIARPPVVGGKVSKVDYKATLAVKGVRKVLEMPMPKAPYGFQQWGGIAVIAENTWAAMKGREALKITWDHGNNVKYDSVNYRKDLVASAKKGGKILRKKGDVDSAFKEAANVIEAEYYVPHLPHQTMEPPVSIANYTKDNGGFCEVWAPTQNPQAARTEIARILGMSEEKVRVNVTFLGGGFGRKSKADFCGESAWLSKEMGQPVRMQFTREDDMHNDYPNTVNAQTLTAGIDKSGKVTAWRVKTAFPPIGTLFDTKATTPANGDLQQGVLDLAINVPNVEAHGCEADAHIRIGWLRSVYNIFHSFATNSFLDEIAHAQKKDPLTLMLEIYADKRMSISDLGVPELKNYGLPLEAHPVDGTRLRNVLKQVAKSSGWKNRTKIKNHGFGIAVHRSFLSYVGVVASVVKDKESQIKVDEVWITIDAGTIINTDRVRAQMEGSVINAMTYLFHGGITYKNGAVEQSSFDDAPILRMDMAPRKIHVDIVRSNANPGGVGEPGLPPTAPAIANAIFALTGKRIREFASPDLNIT
jgi:isoquinoline 1-oxidoreductase beta subunit